MGEDTVSIIKVVHFSTSGLPCMLLPEMATSTQQNPLLKRKLIKMG